MASLTLSSKTLKDFAPAIPVPSQWVHLCEARRNLYDLSNPTLIIYNGQRMVGFNFREFLGSLFCHSGTIREASESLAFINSYVVHHLLKPQLLPLSTQPYTSAIIRERKEIYYRFCLLLWRMWQRLADPAFTIQFDKACLRLKIRWYQRFQELVDRTQDALELRAPSFLAYYPDYKQQQDAPTFVSRFDKRGKFQSYADGAITEFEGFWQGPPVMNHYRAFTSGSGDEIEPYYLPGKHDNSADYLKPFLANHSDRVLRGTHLIFALCRPMNTDWLDTRVPESYTELYQTLKKRRRELSDALIEAIDKHPDTQAAQVGVLVKSLHKELEDIVLTEMFTDLRRLITEELLPPESYESLDSVGRYPRSLELHDGALRSFFSMLEYEEGDGKRRRYATGAEPELQYLLMEHIHDIWRSALPKDHSKQMHDEDSSLSELFTVPLDAEWSSKAPVTYFDPVEVVNVWDFYIPVSALDSKFNTKKNPSGKRLQFMYNAMCYFFNTCLAQLMLKSPWYRVELLHTNTPRMMAFTGALEFRVGSGFAPLDPYFGTIQYHFVCTDFWQYVQGRNSPRSTIKYIQNGKLHSDICFVNSIWPLHRPSPNSTAMLYIEKKIKKTEATFKLLTRILTMASLLRNALNSNSARTRVLCRLVFKQLGSLHDELTKESIETACAEFQQPMLKNGEFIWMKLDEFEQKAIIARGSTTSDYQDLGYKMPSAERCYEFDNTVALFENRSGVKSSLVQTLRYARLSFSVPQLGYLRLYYNVIYTHFCRLRQYLRRTLANGPGPSPQEKYEFAISYNLNKEEDSQLKIARKLWHHIYSQYHAQFLHFVV